MTEPHTGIIKGATNEWVLLVFRSTTTLALTVITVYVIGTRDDTRAINKDLSDFKIAYAERIAHVEGQVGELKGSIETHRMRLAGIDADLRAIWGRIYEMVSRTNGTTKATP